MGQSTLSVNVNQHGISFACLQPRTPLATGVHPSHQKGVSSVATITHAASRAYIGSDEEFIKVIARKPLPSVAVDQQIPFVIRCFPWDGHQEQSYVLYPIPPLLIQTSPHCRRKRLHSMHFYSGLWKYQLIKSLGQNLLYNKRHDKYSTVDCCKILILSDLELRILNF